MDRKPTSDWFSIFIQLHFGGSQCRASSAVDVGSYKSTFWLEWVSAAQFNMPANLGLAPMILPTFLRYNSTHTNDPIRGFHAAAITYVVALIARLCFWPHNHQAQSGLCDCFSPGQCRVLVRWMFSLPEGIADQNFYAAAHVRRLNLGAALITSASSLGYPPAGDNGIRHPQ